MPLKIIKIKGSDNWYIRGTLRGVPVFKTTGTPRKEAADDQRRELEDNILNGANYTFGQAALKYLDAGGSGKFLTDQFDKETDEWTGVLGQFENTFLSDIGQSELEEGAKAAYPNVKPQTLNRQFYTPFIAVWNYAVSLEWCHKKEWRRPKVRRSDVKKTRWFFYETAAQFYPHLPAHIKPLFIFWIYTGARPTEAIELDIKDLNLKKRWAVLNATKTDAYRGVPLHKVVVKELKEYLGDRKEGRVFLTNLGVPYESKRGPSGPTEGGGYVKTSWAKALESAKLSGYTPYSTRHSLNNWLIMLGVEKTTREAIMGHDDGSTNVMYSDVPQAHLIRIIDQLPDFTDFSRRSRKNHGMFPKNSASKGKIKKAK